jgi:hypothetical protein
MLLVSRNEVRRFTFFDIHKESTSFLQKHGWGPTIAKGPRSAGKTTVARKRGAEKGQNCAGSQFERRMKTNEIDLGSGGESSQRAKTLNDFTWCTNDKNLLTLVGARLRL